MSHSSSQSSSQSAPDDQTIERRIGLADRRSNREDRRNLDRVLEDFTPRRNPDRPDRRGR